MLTFVDMDEAGNSSVLDTSEGALVVDLSLGTDDSQLTDISRCTPSDSKTTDTSKYTTDDSEQTDVFPCTNDACRTSECNRRTDSQRSQISVCSNSDSEATDVMSADKRGVSDRGSKEGLAAHTEEHRGPKEENQTHWQSERPTVASDEDVIHSSKYTPQKVDLRMAQLAVNAYVSPSKVGSLNTPQKGNSERSEVHGDKKMDKINKHEEETGNSFPNREQPYVAKPGQTKSKTTDLYSQEMSKLYANMQCHDHTPRIEKNMSPEDDKEEMADMNETGDHIDLSKMEDEMDTSQAQEGEPIQQLTTEVHCALCNNWFLNMSSYTVHMAKHAKMSSPLLGLKCEKCKKMYYYEMEFKAHIQAHIEMLKVYKCRVCFKPFAEKCELQRHMKIHREKKEFSCHFCGKEFHYTFNLKKHMRTHTGEKPYSCILCELKFTHKNSLNRHMSLHTNETEFECCVCDKVCLDRWTLQKHLASHQILTCTVCEQSFTNSRQLQDHQKTHTETAKETSVPEFPNSQENNGSKSIDTAQSNTETLKTDIEIKPDPDQKPKAKRVRRAVETQCEVCRKVFKNPGNYNRHLQSKEGMPVQTCDLCGHQFHDVYDLLRHTRQVHSQTSDTKGYICQVCGQNYPDLALLTEHMSEHLQNINKAGSAGSKHLLNMNKAGSASSEHIPRTDGSLSLYCSVCGEKFLNPIMLNLHMMEHSSSKRISENVLDLSQSKEDASQSPPRKRLKLETVENTETQEYYDSDKENEPLNLSKKKYSPKAKPNVLRVCQKQAVPVLPRISSISQVTNNVSRHQKSKPTTSSESVGLDLSCKSKPSEASQGIVAGDQTKEHDQETSKPESADNFTKGAEKNETQSLDCEDRDTPMKSPAMSSNVAMDKTGEDFPDENSNLTDKSDHLDQSSDRSSRPGSPPIPLTCEYCVMTFSDPVTLNRHLSSHYKEWAFYCNYCNMMFTESTSYRSHTPIHPSHAPYMCNVCHSHFSDRISLGAHQSQAHPQEKPFQCGVCQRRFPVKSYLGSHCRTHLTERPFKCSICERTFVHNFNLTKHMRTHTGEKPYKCAWCERKFSQKNSLNR